MIIKSYAKINVALSVLRKQDDGFHQLDMVMIPLELHDTIEISLVPPTYDTLVTCDDYDLASSEYNLCSIAADKMRAFYGFKHNFRIHIHKRIPIAAGLGGGSSNAAAVIRGIIELLKLKTSENDVIAICRTIGSDVPFFYRQTPARVGGTGELLQPIMVQKPYHVLLVKPTMGLNTKRVFEKYDEEPSVTRDITPVIEALERGDDQSLQNALFNDLEPAAFALCPSVEVIKQQLIDNGFYTSLMSGSGSTVYALSENLHKLEKMAIALAKQGHKIIISQLRLKKTVR